MIDDVSRFDLPGYASATMRLTAQRWDCQLIHVDVVEDGVVLDLIALAACPFAGVGLPAGWPFVIRILDQRVDGCADLVAAWAERGEVVSLRFVYDTVGARWLDVAGANDHLILELR
jgi:hypothetical protein